ncbi:MAG: NUDIX domain-containing protein, partial [Actinomycetota bacterium]|nr:NUDIX domain-containing protein [Actinomycetota bacterium]
MRSAASSASRASGSARSRARPCPSCATRAARRSCATTSTEVPAGSRPRRQAARVVVRDPDGRVLLLRYDDPPPMGVHWATPGGGIDPG